MDQFTLARDNMIKGQILPNRIHDANLIEQMSDIPRQLFVPEAYKTMAYSDENIALSDARYMVSPFIFAQMLQATQVKKDDVVLDIACGTGYSSAVFSALAKKVVAIESDADLASKANLVLKKLNVGNVIILNEKVNLGCAESAPYDVIFIGNAVEKTPYALLDQLAEGGRLVTVVNCSPYNGALTVFKREHGQVIKTEVFDVLLPVVAEFKGEDEDS